MRRITWIVAIVMSVALVLAGCGKKDAGSVVNDLDHVINKLDSYQAVGTMVLHTGQQPQQYGVEVWYQKQNYYRIELTNEQKDVRQIVLRNDDGVFVLTPHLNKSFRFQSDWPDNQGQVYLYQSLVRSILSDKDRQFAKGDDGSYVFDVLANYQNASLARQKIWMDAKTYAPKKVEVADANGNVLIHVEFSKFDFGKKFDSDSFDMQRNMTSSSLQSLPTMAPLDAGTGLMAGGAAKDVSKDAAKDASNDASKDKATSATKDATKDAGKVATKDDSSKGMTKDSTAAVSKDATTKATANANATANATATKDTHSASFGVIEPMYLPDGVKRQDMKDIILGEDKAVLLRYTGKYSFNLVESNPTVETVAVMPGTILDLGFTLGVVTGEGDMKTLMWTDNGVEYRLSTADLPQTDMIRVVQSMQDASGK
jgi:outer membrane lipoprotein-sorting protein